LLPSHLKPSRLPLGTLVGPWRILERRGLGSYGAIYRALHSETPSGPVALKLALHPGDPRFDREGELLSRIRHPCVPRLLDQGLWLHPAGLSFPYLAMELVDGVSLYQWALELRPSSRQVLHVLSRIARALEATHSAGGLHRDVKGDNVLVSNADGRVFLTDFGSGHYLGATTLTPPPFPPSTPAYRSPEAWRFEQRSAPAPSVAYAPGPADELFALGVTAFRLVADQYPASPGLTSNSEPGQQAAPPSARALNSRCHPMLSELTSRLLSPTPEARGTAREVAEALEAAAREAGPEADVPIFEEPPEPEETRPPAREVSPRAPGRARRRWLAAASMGGALALGAGWMLRAQLGAEVERRHAAVSEGEGDGGTVAVGDTALTAPVPPTRPPSAWASVAVDLPLRPLPGQRRPDARGRCPLKAQVPINGGCWIRLPVEPENCKEEGYVYKGGCYVPSFPPARPPTSSPAEREDDTP
jgi:serine/threonine-protein kinase